MPIAHHALSWLAKALRRLA